ncbi:beta-1,3-glucanase family protein [Catelliglobosispora koreensis]|uniref:beta-1,3-glucanase family protein n=1 Tax=Catelliglobosispora koreensis TaxID=129052 RepID=UPI00037EE18B|nr:beta-1,3-glucanase family protein [Catelliglobosispora koreensis]
MRTSTRIASVLAAIALVLPLSVASPAQAIGPDLLPVTVTNSTGRGEAVYLYVIGVNLATGRLGYVNGAGTFTAWSGGQLPPSPAPDVSIGGPGNGGNTTIRFPRGFSGRVYFSLGQKLQFFLTPDGLVQPAPWAAGDPNQNILFDWSEFTYNDAGLWLNSSQVDMFAIPHAVTVTGSSGATKRTGDVVANGRDTIINTIRAQSGWANTIYSRADGTVLRALAPGKAADAGRFSATYLDSYIASAWGAYASKTLTVVPFGDQPSIRYFGRTSGTVMTFTNSSGSQVASFNRPSSADVWGCAGNLHAPNDLVVGPIARTLCAALNRGTMGTIDTQPSLNAGDFYKNNPTNQYAKIIHANMVDGKAYAFPFDDVGAFESLVHDGDPRSAGLILSPFTGGGGGPGPIPPAAGTITGPGGKCVDVAGDDNGGNGTAVQLWDCQSNAVDQRWTHNANNSLTTLGRCLDVVSGGTANGSKVQLWDCNGSGAQKWVQQADGSLRNPQSGRCLDSPSGATANGTRLQIWDCNGSGAQKFSVNGGGTILGPGGKCVDVAGDDNGVNGTSVQLWDCQSQAVDQHWFRNTNGSLRTLGRCLDIVSGGVANGTQVQLWDCNGTGAQAWQQQADGSLRNPQSGRCLDSPSGATANGTRLQIWDCNGSAAQKFALS